MKRTWKIFVKDILLSINKIEKNILGISYNEFIKNDTVFDAVIRNLEVIGEASKNIPNNIKITHNEIPWKRMVGLRNIVIHEYFGIDTTIIWQIITKNLPQIEGDLKKIYLEK